MASKFNEIKLYGERTSTLSYNSHRFPAVLKNSNGFFSLKGTKLTQSHIFGKRKFKQVFTAQKLVNLKKSDAIGQAPL